MASIETRVAEHYSSGTLFDRIMEGLGRLGTAGAIAPASLKLVDEFHIGGVEATRDVLAQLAIRPGDRVLDIGCGIGGTARFIAQETGASVTGVDVTEEFVDTARRLTALAEIDDIEFFEASALALPFEAHSFDVATLMHVGMNIEDKPGLFREAGRVLRAGGVFAVYDVMQTGAGELGFPVPWSSAPETSFLAPPEIYRAAAEGAGFTLVAERGRRDFAVAFFAALQAKIAQSGPPPVGLPLIMGERAAEKISNMVAGLRGGLIAPVEMIFRAA